MYWFQFIITTLTFFYLNYAFAHSSNNYYEQEDMGYEIGELINKHGYPFEKHTVTTEDGYILNLHRIPFGKASINNKKRPPILVVHGLLGSSITWLLVGLEKALPYILADNGYDVWLANCRGNKYSRKHITLNPDLDEKNFFNFSWHEIGFYDLPAMVNYVINITNENKIFYIGHSQGCASFFVFMSERPNYNSKIRMMVALAPVVYTKGVKNLVFTLPAFVQRVYKPNYVSNIFEMFPLTYFNTIFGNTFCSDKSIFQQFCLFGMFSLFGYNYKNLNKTKLPLIFSHFPAGSSSKQLYHYTQILNSDTLQQYNYGKNGNIIKYGQKTPPLYNLDNVKVPVSIFYGNNDLISNDHNVNRLVSELNNVVCLEKVKDDLFTHTDFVFGNNAVDILYSHVLIELEKY